MIIPKAIISLCSSFFFFTVSFSQQINIVYDNGSNAKETIHSNNIVEEVVYKYKIQHKPDSSILMIRRYDSTGNIIESLDYNDKSLVKRTTYIYNFQNQLTKSISNSVKSNSNSIQEYVYDSLGNEINEYDYNQDTSTIAPINW